MAPKKKAAAKGKAQKPLDGCYITLAGAFEGKKHSEIRELIDNAGGHFTASVTANTTHLLVPDDLIVPLWDKTEKAVSRGIHIVAYRWLDESITRGSKADEDKFEADVEDENDPCLWTNKRKRKSSDDSDSDGEDSFSANTPANGASKTKVAKLKKKSSSPAAGSAAQKGGSNIKTQTFQGRAPVDEVSGLCNTHHVFERDGVAFDCMLNQVNIGGNNCKFYVIQILRQIAAPHSLKLYTRWGRVGEDGKDADRDCSYEEQAIEEFCKKFREKTGIKWQERETTDPKPKKYTWLERDYTEEDDESPQDDSGGGGKLASPVKQRSGAQPKSQLEPSVFELGKLIFGQKYVDLALREMHYDASKMPLGKLSKTTIDRGYSKLSELDDLLGDPQMAGSEHERILELTSQYYTLIPHAYPRHERPPAVNTRDKVQREVQLVDSLRQMMVGEGLKTKDKTSQGSEDGEAQNSIDVSMAKLGLQKIEAVPKNSSEYKALESYCLKTKGETHVFNFTVQDIFRVERDGDEKRFKPWKDTKPDNRQLLWHGSRLTNFTGILSEGLRIAPPQAPVSGYMFGKGIYLADMSSKSIQYCHASSSEGIGLLLLAEAQLGEPLVLDTSDPGAADRVINSKPEKHSTHGQGYVVIPKDQWVDAGDTLGRPDLRGVKMPQGSPKQGEYTSLYYDEKIVYRETQVRFRYLFRLAVN